MNYWNEMILTLKELISYNTTRGKSAPNAPFGANNRAALSSALETAERLGFVTKDIEGYAGHIEWTGSGDELVGILGHLDVVPAGEGWDVPPYELTEKDGYLYGRGILDDKGPVVACLYAMKRLKDEGFVPKKTIRLIMGCNEENGSTCIHRYFQTEQMPDVAFSPDGDFPLIHCEKGIVWVGASFNTKLKTFQNFHCGEKTNMVPSKAVCEYTGNLPTEFFIEKGLNAVLNDETKVMTLTARGKSAHGSTPNKGINAIAKLLKVVSATEQNEYFDYLVKAFGSDLDGSGAEIKSEDVKSGKLTLNLGTLESDGDNFAVSVDVRYPISITEKSIFDTLNENAPKGMKLESLNSQEGLFVDPDSDLVQTLLKIYHDVTGSQSPSISIGGGTYARELKCGVAFGPIFEGEESTIHMPNERASVENFKKMFEIYYRAIKEMAE
ncbi:MAG: Sapep family Mn(2+)-dependent dipeptidase [Clostridia bacterium]